MLRRLLLAGCAALLSCAGRAGVALPPKWSAVLTRSGAIEPQRGHIQGLCATEYESYVHNRLRADTEIDDLRVCRMKEPGDIVRPVFSWKMTTERNGARQAAYSISLKDSGGRDVWQSGLVKDGASHAVKYSGPALKSATRYVWQVIVTDDRGKEFFSQPARFTTGLISPEEWKGSKWIAVPGIDPSVPKETRKKQRANDGASVFAKTLRNPKKVKEAWWTVTGQGVFQAYVNSKALPDFLKPGFTHVFKTRHSFTYDVTLMFNCEENGQNRLSATVTSGWWRDRITDWRGKESAFRAVLTVRYADGSEARFGTDVTWSGAVDTHVKAAGIFDGEEYDAGAPEPAWGAVRVVDEFKGEIVPMEGPKVNLRSDLKLLPREMYVYSGVEGAKDGDAFGRVVKKDAGRRDVILNPGETLVVDFGQNAAAVPEFRFSAKRGARLVAKAGEMLNDGNGEKSRGNDGPAGSVYRGNLNELSKWGAKAEYVFGGDSIEFYRPEWTFFGYRYLAITVSDRTHIQYIASVPVSSIAKSDETGRLLTGDKRVNRLVENIRWGQLSNYLSVPTDCPQRNERLGWTADTQVFVRAATRNADVYGFLRKWMRDMRDTQHADGSFAGVAPLAAYGDRSERFGWCDAGVIVPYVMWKRYGDLAIVEENFDAIERYMALTAKNKFDSPAANPYQWGDWLSFEPLESHDGGAFEKDAKGKTVPKADALVYWHFLGGCHWLMDAAMCSEMAGALGKKEASARYGKMEEEAREYVRRRFLGKDGGLPDFMRNMQTPNLFAVKCGIFEKPEAEASAKKALLENIKNHGNCLQTGFLGTPIILDVLTYGLGRADVAYTLLLQRDNPSWLYSVDQGATTVWERWNGYSKADGFLRLSMKSYNHYAYGSVLDWMYGTMAGIRPDPDAPGWRHFVLAPVPDRRVGRVQAAFESQYGTIESAWAYGGDDEIMFRFRVPPNTTARVVLPDGTEREVASGIHEYSIKGKKK